ncbi:MAG: hypothetical protein U9Q71_09310 [Pseudomonadota bacterium]|nr:hypothetical protein [Pseudomonadota bacterium]
MPLFHPKILRKHLLQNVDVPPAQLQILQAWRRMIEDGTLLNLKKTEVHSAFTRSIMLDLLGYRDVGGQADDQWSLAQEYPIGSGQVDIALGEFDQDKTTDSVIAPFELKGAKTRDLDAIMPGRHKSPVQQAWDYARDARGAEWVLVSNYTEIRLYAIGETSLVYEGFDLA